MATTHVPEARLLVVDDEPNIVELLEASLRLAAVQQLAQSAGLPHLREYVIGSYVVLYAHSDTEVVLLSLKHHRQLTYITLQ